MAADRRPLAADQPGGRQVTLLVRKAIAWDERLERGDRNAFDIVRLMLASLVVLEHSFFLIDNSSGRDPLSVLSHGQTNSGQVAVYMFFSLSGFLVTYSLMQSASFWQFMGKRIARIVPGFLVASMIGVFVVGPLTTPNLALYFYDQQWLPLIANALALKQVNVAHALGGNPLPLVHGTLWTIQYEFDCYLIIGLIGAAGLLKPNLRPFTFVAIALALATGWFVRFPTINWGLPSLFLSSPERWPDLFPFFFLGSAFYLFRERVPKSAALFGISVASIAFSFAFAGAHWALLLAGTYVVLYISLSCAAELKLLGRRVDLSYGVYLFGWPIQQLLLYVFQQKLAAISLFVTSLPLSYSAAWASWTWVERPCLAFVRRRSLS
jgi:peptidoglycan/LPS O-acetylase OafA/YrhL